MTLPYDNTTVAQKERPILFKDEMVRAILEGRKTQTRRLMRDQVVAPGVVQMARPGYCEIINEHGVKIPGFSCPYGQPGDRLWVREAWAQPTTLDPGPTFYRADYPECVPAHFQNVPTADAIKWKPSIHMPRLASRITLEITNVRVERLQKISEADAIAEGCDNSTTEAAKAVGWYEKPIKAFRRLWESINGPGSWEANPWVWVIEFKRVQP